MKNTRANLNHHRRGCSHRIRTLKMTNRNEMRCDCYKVSDSHAYKLPGSKARHCSQTERRKKNFV